MPKPQWLIDKEQGVQRIRTEPNTCGKCKYFGRHIKMIRYKGASWEGLHECDVHPGCFNTKFSICCDDWKSS